MKNEYKIFINLSDTDINYWKALKEIKESGIVDSVVISFFDKEESNLLGEIKTADIGNQSKRILILNENTSSEAIPSAIRKLASSIDDQQLRGAIDNKSIIKLVAAY